MRNECKEYFEVNIVRNCVLIRNATDENTAPLLRSGLRIQVDSTPEAHFHLIVLALVAKHHRDTGCCEWVSVLHLDDEIKRLSSALCGGMPKFKDHYANIRTMWFAPDRGLTIRSGYEAFEGDVAVPSFRISSSLQNTLGGLLEAKGTGTRLKLRIMLEKIHLEAADIQLPKMKHLLQMSHRLESVTSNTDTEMGATLLKRVSEWREDNAAPSTPIPVDVIASIDHLMEIRSNDEGYQIHFLNLLNLQKQGRIGLRHLFRLASTASDHSARQRAVEILARMIASEIPEIRCQILRFLDKVGSLQGDWRAQKGLSWWHDIRELIRKDTILFCDDDDSQLKLYKLICADAGYESVFVESCSSAAIELAKRIKPRIVITDYFKASMNGHEFARAILALKGFKELPVVLITGCSNMASMDVKPFRVILRKPVSANELIDTIEDTLSSQHPPPYSMHNDDGKRCV